MLEDGTEVSDLGRGDVDGRHFLKAFLVVVGKKM